MLPALFARIHGRSQHQLTKTQQADRLPSVKVLARDILAFSEHGNANCRPFKWTATAEDILQKAKVITSNMTRLEKAVVITDVTRQAA
jgi:hypothetical protein